jgi:hypothetical protein
MSSAAEDKLLSIPLEVTRRLGFYVYLYLDPRDGRPFYVGKGQGERALAHLSAHGESRKAQMLTALRNEGLEPRIEILAHALPNEESALRIEAAVIDLLELDQLTNEVRGWRSIQLGRMPLSELIIYYAAQPVTVIDPVVLIRINRLYRHGMSARELYEATRGVWKLGERRHNARYAFAVFEGIVREVYQIDAWHPAGTTPYITRPAEDVQSPGRWEFTGQLAAEAVRSRYVGRPVSTYFTPGSQNPVAYVNA